MTTIKLSLSLFVFLLTTSLTILLQHQAVHAENADSSFAKYGDICDANFDRCEPIKGYMCKKGRCTCSTGYYNSDKDACLVKFGQQCFGGSHDRYVGLAGQHLDCEDSFAYCNQLTSLCECRKGYDCSSAGPSYHQKGFMALMASLSLVVCSLYYYGRNH